MKKIILALGIIVSGAPVFAQKNVSMFSVSINGGIASPMGNFAKGDYADQTSGFAKLGGNFNIIGAFRVHKNFGIAALVGYSQFGYKGSQSLSDGYKEDSGTDSTTLYLKGHNSSFSVLAGPYFSIPAGKKVAVTLRAMGGYVHAHLAGFQIFYEDYLTNAMTQEESSAGAFGFQAGAGLQYNIDSKIFIAANADYFYSKPTFNIKYDDFVVNSGRRLSTYSQPVEGINTTLGVGISF
jgi:opacity protein-like surface antigen